MSGRETDIYGMYPPILNCGYRNDKIVFDCTKYEPPIDIEDGRQEIKEEKTLFRDRKSI